MSRNRKQSNFKA